MVISFEVVIRRENHNSPEHHHQVENIDPGGGLKIFLEMNDSVAEKWWAEPQGGTFLL